MNSIRVTVELPTIHGLEVAPSESALQPVLYINKPAMKSSYIKSIFPVKLSYKLDNVSFH